MACNGQCRGCALKPGAAANLEPENKLTAVIGALGGIPFYCHEAMGWTEDQETYPGGKPRVDQAIKNLLSAPKLIHDLPAAGQMISDATATGIQASAFAADREFMGKAPVCVGWKEAVAKLNEAGWFENPQHRKVLRIMASMTLKDLDRLKVAKRANQRKKILKTIAESVAWFAKEHLIVTGQKIDIGEVR